MNEEMSGELFDDHHDEQTTRIDADMHMHAGVEVIDDALQFNRRETGQSVMLENSQTEISSMLRRSKDYRPPGQNSGKRRGQMDKKLCKSIQNNIEMYFKRDYAKLKPQKEISTSRQKLVKTKKSVTKGPNVGSLGIGQVQTGTMKRHEINCSTHRVLKHGESVSLSQRGPSQTGTNSDR